MGATKKEQNFGLDEEEFFRLSSELKRNNDVLFERVFLSHFEYCIKFLQMKYKVSYDEAYDATMDTTLEFRLRILDDKVRYGNLRFLFNKMASQELLRNIKKFQIREVVESDLVEEKVLDREDIIILKRAWNSLGNDCQSLLRLNFFSGMKLSAIAELKEKSAASIRKQKERCLSKLIGHFKREQN